MYCSRQCSAALKRKVCVLLGAQLEALKSHRAAVEDGLTFSADIICKAPASSGERMLTANFRWACSVLLLCGVLACFAPTCIVLVREALLLLGQSEVLPLAG